MTHSVTSRSPPIASGVRRPNVARVLRDRCRRFRWTRPVIRALGIVKKAAALANHELGELDADRAG